MDSIFVLPFFSGLCIALILPALGCYLRLRNEWLAALAYSNVAAAGALAAMAVGAPLGVGGLLAGVLAATAKRTLAQRLAQGSVYALFLALGWAVAVLLTSNLPMAERLGHALFDGQLYFIGPAHFVGALFAWLGGAWVLRASSQHLLLVHVFPQLAAVRGCSGRHELVFDLLVAVVLALSTMVLGVMGAFALVFIPAWVAFARGADWKSGLRWAVGLGLAAYLAAFAVALWLDQPFAPVLVMALLALAGVSLLWRRDCASPRNMLKH